MNTAWADIVEIYAHGPPPGQWAPIRARGPRHRPTILRQPRTRDRRAVTITLTERGNHVAHTTLGAIDELAPELHDFFHTIRTCPQHG